MFITVNGRNSSHGLIIAVTTGVGFMMVITVILYIMYARNRRKRRNQAYMYVFLNSYTAGQYLHMTLGAVHC